MSTAQIDLDMIQPTVSDSAHCRQCHVFHSYRTAAGSSSSVETKLADVLPGLTEYRTALRDTKVPDVLSPVLTRKRPPSPSTKKQSVRSCIPQRTKPPYNDVAAAPHLAASDTRGA